MLTGSVSSAQTGQSPYTFIGLGDVVHPQLVSNMGMGGSTIAYPSNKNFNFINPAMLGIRSYFTSFEVGFTGERRTISQDTARQFNGAGNLNYLALAFPIRQSLISSGIGLAPYSYVNYNIITNERINGIEEEATLNLKGNGGYNSVFWSNGINLFRSLALGVKVSYLFGSRVDETIFEIDTTTSYATALFERTKVNDFNVSFGLAYNLRLGEESQLFLGGIYELPSQIGATREKRLERRQKGGDLAITTDTVFNDVKGNIQLPAKYGVGISYARGTKWLISADAIVQDWNRYSSFDDQNKNLAKSYRTAFGIEHIPEATSVSSYFRRIIYRAGMSYELTPYELNNNQIYDFGINFGVSLPVININSPSLVSISLQYGQRSREGELAITEKYFRVSLGLTINDIWFYRRKIE